MSRYHSYINSAIKLIESYDRKTPFNIFIKHFFAKEKKYGSKDRKQIAALCYSYFRLGLAFKSTLKTDQLLASLFLCSDGPSEIIRELKPEWNEKINTPLDEKISFIRNQIFFNNVFPYKQELNDSIDIEMFERSFFIQPDLFIRIRPEQKNNTIKKITASGLQHQFLNNNDCVRFSSTTNIDNILEPDKEIVIQDYNSQQVLNFLKQIENDNLSVWDCCAASGGKSILLTDILTKKFNLTVSDIRPAIITNLQKRFQKASVKDYQYFITDISTPNNINIPNAMYDIIICDAPCTGSGTWSRTPEQLYFFDPGSIIHFEEMQKRIVSNVLPHLKEKGLFFYITCSVFRKENAAVAEYIQQQKGMHLLQLQHLYGYDKKADSMFVAVFKKTNTV